MRQLGPVALVLAAPALAAAAGRWAGVDEAVVERIATEAGRHPWHILDGMGDLPFFLYLCAGTASGFALGYYFRVLFVEPRRERGDKP